VFIAGNGDSLALLKHEFPGLHYFKLPGYQPEYPSGNNMALKMITQLPKFLSVISEEHRMVESIVQTNSIDVVISDNRYGCWSASVPSILITHQLNILMPKRFNWLSGVINSYNRRLIGKFSCCWIPDYPGDQNSLSGRLSEVDSTHAPSVIHIGPLSRFTSSGKTGGEYDVACILSGPEPQRSIFEDIVVRQLKKSALRYVIVRGVVHQDREDMPNAIPFLNSSDLQDVISKSSLVIARSGYSTIMDLLALRKKGIVVPTPGQTEQEYLADRWSQRGVLYATTQDSFNLEIALKESGLYTGFKNGLGKASELLKPELDRILNKKFD
jgi:uncharacterized protein (TIGR00661 family)